MKTLRAHASYLFWGALFGFIISRSGAVRFDMINGMFLLTDLRLYGMIGSAIATALPGLLIMKALKKRNVPAFKKIRFPKRSLTKGTLPGAAIFGLGWALTGTCPGPAMIQLGEGHGSALATVAGIFLGNLVYGLVHEKYFDWTPDFCS
ncbi:MAG: DUF6691 family protein [candidate division FCPU426 bacterium]